MLIKKQVVCNFLSVKLIRTHKALFFTIIQFRVRPSRVKPLIAKFIVIAHDFVSAAY